MPISVEPILRIQNKKSYGHIHIRLHSNYETTYIPTGQKLDKKDWNKKNAVVRVSHEDHDLLNKKLRNITRRVHAIYDELYEEYGDSVTMAEVKGLYHRPRKARPRTLIEGYRSFYELQLKKTGDTSGLYRQQFAHLVALEKEAYPGSSWLWSDVGEESTLAFVQFLGQGGSSSNKPLKLSTVGQQLRAFKRFLKWSKGQGWHQDISYDAVTVKTFNDESETITQDEVMALLEITEIPSMTDYSKMLRMTQKQKAARDQFVFLFLTGARISDKNKVKESTVYEREIEGEMCRIWRFVSEKTDTYTEVGLSDVAYEIYQSGSINTLVSDEYMRQLLPRFGYAAKLFREVTVITRTLNEVKQEKKELWQILTPHKSRSGFMTHLVEDGEMSQLAVGHLGGVETPTVARYHKNRDEYILQQLKAQK